MDQSGHLKWIKVGQSAPKWIEVLPKALKSHDLVSTQHANLSVLNGGEKVSKRPYISRSPAKCIERAFVTWAQHAFCHRSWPCFYVACVAGRVCGQLSGLECASWLGLQSPRTQCMPTVLNCAVGGGYRFFYRASSSLC